MPERRGSRFVVEALFLAGLAVALALAKLDPAEIVGAMALGWVAVATIEWIAWRGEPHYGSGLPPRYYLPRLELPPPQPLEQVEQGYPSEGRDDAPTWIASAALREQVLGDWPLFGPARQEADDEPVLVPEAEADDPWTAIELPPTPHERVEPVVSASAPLVRREPTSALPASWYSFDPLGEAPTVRRFRRGGARDAEGIRVPALPATRPLPGSVPAGA